MTLAVAVEHLALCLRGFLALGRRSRDDGTRRSRGHDLLRLVARQRTKGQPQGPQAAQYHRLIAVSSLGAVAEQEE